MANDPPDLLDNAAAAAHISRLAGREMSVIAWRSLARRSGIEPELRAGGHPLWRAATVERIALSAPGQGNRPTTADDSPGDDSPSDGRPESLEDLAERMPVTIHGVSATAAFTIPSLAAWLGIPKSTVRHWSVNGRGPKRYRRGREVRYAAADVKEWLTSRLADRPGDSVTRAIIAKYPKLRRLTVR